ncbi:hypothetical protein AVEN_144631-1 [Araneus ventricosus]|uniref:Uncharacterized protein n=1 Tax=Araneus ventricosus TaxID=182803 RepID=A0A4Y2BYQ4_ARAVE|nr:hypothetical protein AVEN_144631-1 [Araneus ventricosus]
MSIPTCLAPLSPHSSGELRPIKKLLILLRHAASRVPPGLTAYNYCSSSSSYDLSPCHDAPLPSPVIHLTPVQNRMSCLVRLTWLSWQRRKSWYLTETKLYPGND